MLAHAGYADLMQAIGIASLGADDKMVGRQSAACLPLHTCVIILPNLGSRCPVVMAAKRMRIHHCCFLLVADVASD